MSYVLVVMIVVVNVVLAVLLDEFLRAASAEKAEMVRSQLVWSDQRQRGHSKGLEFILARISRTGIPQFRFPFALVAP